MPQIALTVIRAIAEPANGRTLLDLTADNRAYQAYVNGTNTGLEESDVITLSGEWSPAPPTAVTHIRNAHLVEGDRSRLHG